MLQSAMKRLFWSELDSKLHSFTGILYRQGSGLLELEKKVEQLRKDGASSSRSLAEQLRAQEDAAGGQADELRRQGERLRLQESSARDLVERLCQQEEQLRSREEAIRGLAEQLHRQGECLRAQEDRVGEQAGQIARYQEKLRLCEEALAAVEAEARRHKGLDPLLTEETARISGRVPLSWVRSTAKVPYSNLGDALSALVVSVMAGLPIEHRAFNSTGRRLAAVGTIGQGQSAGTVHFWGTGVDPRRRGFGDRTAGFAAAPGVEYVVHATRGPFTRRALLTAGIEAPAVYGDPAWFMPRILRPQVEKTHELGVIMHISELEAPGPEARPAAELARYAGGEADGVRLISTYHEPSWEGFVAKMAEILSCRRIVSTSFHGLLLADAYQIPCLYFPYGCEGLTRLELEGRYDDAVDHRFADFYRGAGRSALMAYGQARDVPTGWDRVIAAVDRAWEPLGFTGERLFEAFPLAPAVDFAKDRWPIGDAEAAALPW